MDDPGALYNLGVLALETPKRAPDFPKAADYSAALRCLARPDAAYSLALFYREGKGAPQDDVMAAEWMKQAADEGQVSAEVEYAIMLFNGVGVAKDEAAAAKLFLKAAGGGIMSSRRIERRGCLRLAAASKKMWSSNEMASLSERRGRKGCVARRHPQFADPGTEDRG